MVTSNRRRCGTELPGILTSAHANGVPGTSLMPAAEVAAREPGLAPTRAAVLVPGECLIDPWSPFHAYAQQILALGGEVRRDCAVTGALLTGRNGGWTLQPAW